MATLCKSIDVFRSRQRRQQRFRREITVSHSKIPYIVLFRLLLMERFTVLQQANEGNRAFPGLNRYLARVESSTKVHDRLSKWFHLVDLMNVCASRGMLNLPPRLILDIC